jgi:hypothetical protein
MTLSKTITTTATERRYWRPATFWSTLGAHDARGGMKAAAFATDLLIGQNGPLCVDPERTALHSD